jgi:hypothetical protein
LDHPIFEGILVLQPTRFYPCPSSMTTSKLYDDSIFGNSVWHCFYKIYGFIPVRQLATIVNVEGVFMPRKFNLISENFKLFSQ